MVLIKIIRSILMNMVYKNKTECKMKNEEEKMA